MLDRLFMPALTFTLLVAATAAFAVEFSTGHRQDTAQAVVILERVVVTATAADLSLARSERADESSTSAQ